MKEAIIPLQTRSLSKAIIASPVALSWVWREEDGTSMIVQSENLQFLKIETGKNIVLDSTENAHGLDARQCCLASGTACNKLAGNQLQFASPYRKTKPVSGNPFQIVKDGELSVWLDAFSVVGNQDRIDVSWETVYELDNLGFEIEKSMDGDDWSKVGFIEGQGFTLEKQKYTFTDHHPNQGLNHYRLKQLDFEGACGYSKVGSASTDPIIISFEVYPNPVYGNLDVVATTTYNGDAHLIFYDYMGIEVLRTVMKHDRNILRTSIDLSGLTSGFYLIKVDQSTKGSI